MNSFRLYASRIISDHKLTFMQFFVKAFSAGTDYRRRLTLSVRGPTIDADKPFQCWDRLQTQINPFSAGTDYRLRLTLSVRGPTVDVRKTLSVRGPTIDADKPFQCGDRL